MVLNTGYTHFHGPEVNTRAVVSQKVRLFSYNNTAETGSTDQQQIGVMTTFGVNEDRNVEAIRGIGFGDRIAELVPGVTSPVTIQASRIALWLSNIMQVFGYKSGVEGIIRSLRHHRWPFDIRQEMVFSEINSTVDEASSVKNVKSQFPNDRDSISKAVGSTGVDVLDVPILVTFYEGCWMNSYSTSFDANQAIVTENCGITVSDITAGEPTSNADLGKYFIEDSNQDKAFRVRP